MNEFVLVLKFWSRPSPLPLHPQKQKAFRFGLGLKAKYVENPRSCVSCARFHHAAILSNRKPSLLFFLFFKNVFSFFTTTNVVTSPRLSLLVAMSCAFTDWQSSFAIPTSSFFFLVRLFYAPRRFFPFLLLVSFCEAVWPVESSPLGPEALLSSHFAFHARLLAPLLTFCSSTGLSVCRVPPFDGDFCAKY